MKIITTIAAPSGYYLLHHAETMNLLLNNNANYNMYYKACVLISISLYYSIMVVGTLFRLMLKRMISLHFPPPKYATSLGISKNNYKAKALYNTNVSYC